MTFRMKQLGIVISGLSFLLFTGCGISIKSVLRSSKNGIKRVSVSTSDPTEDGYSQFAERLFQDLLRRAGQVSEIEFVASALRSGTSNRSAFAQGMYLGQEAWSRDINIYTQNYLKRSPDLATTTHYLQMVGFNSTNQATSSQNGQTRESIQAAILASDEYFRVTSAGQTTTLMQDFYFVGHLYYDVLRRAADAGGLNGWTSAIDSNQRTRTDVAGEFLESQEYQANVLIPQLYNQFMHRAPSAAEIAASLEILKNGGDATVVGDIVSKDEYFPNSETPYNPNQTPPTGGNPHNPTAVSLIEQCDKNSYGDPHVFWACVSASVAQTNCVTSYAAFPLAKCNCLAEYAMNEMQKAVANQNGNYSTLTQIGEAVFPGDFTYYRPPYNSVNYGNWTYIGHNAPTPERVLRLAWVFSLQNLGFGWPIGGTYSQHTNESWNTFCEYNTVASVGYWASYALPADVSAFVIGTPDPAAPPPLPSKKH